MKLDGAFAVVAGGANGIGKQIMIALLAEGAKVTFIDIDGEEGRRTELDLREKYGPGRVLFIECDIRAMKQYENVLREQNRQNGGIDILCNNAGILDNENWQEMINTNMIATIHGTMVAIELMDKTNGNRGGTIVNLVSMAGWLPYKFSPVYAATKHGLVGFTRSMAMITLEKGVRLNMICPSFVDTRMTRGIEDKEWVDMINTFGTVSPELVAKGFIQLVKEDDRNGEALRVTVQNGIDFHTFPAEYGPL